MNSLIEHLQNQELQRCPNCSGTNSRTICIERTGQLETKTKKCDECDYRWRSCGDAIYITGETIAPKRRRSKASTGHH